MEKLEKLRESTVTSLQHLLDCVDGVSGFTAAVLQTVNSAAATTTTARKG